jgi:hypothetical protein
VVVGHWLGTHGGRGLRHSVDGDEDLEVRADAGVVSDGGSGLELGQFWALIV